MIYYIGLYLDIKTFVTFGFQWLISNPGSDAFLPDAKWGPRRRWDGSIFEALGWVLGLFSLPTNNWLVVWNHGIL
jgi:hypothetical protein